MKEYGVSDLRVKGGEKLGRKVGAEK